MPARDTDLLDPATLSGLGNLSLMAKMAVEGFLSGMHRSLFHGFGTEFLQYRNYTPGEDLKYLDWKVYARSDRLYTKVYEEETNMNCYVLLDASASMDYQGTDAPVSKIQYARMAAACIAYLAQRQGDNLGLFAYGEHVREALEPGHRSGQFDRFLKSLVRAKPEGTAAHDALLNSLSLRLRQRGIVVYISDMLEAEDSLPQALAKFRFRHCDVLAIQVLDPDEENLPHPSVSRFQDIESGKEIVAWPEAVRARYREDMDRFLGKLKKGFSGAQIDYLQVNTRASLGLTIAHYLSRREAR
ncbi:DUF58 domain-containing protein [Rubellicoccus peritrichatus]|uniref:DUF58 domain-containing protein n=1 Tax=Rubellicoccus peritrichatus TaxID=3080537 RepID=A0AAQ3L946_9BACT|nr:DUF58 domain-containing protein [Puniceicoccus sp. CR14]WOO41111.1 DUF58 domain-containing protein [Puniceicoccus sp. CR14]